MTNEELVSKCRKIISTVSDDTGIGSFTEASEFLRKYGGKNNSFYAVLSTLNPDGNTRTLHYHIKRLLEGFIRYVENDLFKGISPEKQGQLDTVSDFLEQAQTLLNNKNVHGTAPAVIIGAALEEFIRNWCEDEGLELQKNKLGIDKYAKYLREQKLISKQDIKDITSWAGIRNDAAHGNFEAVSDKNRIKIMLEGVNLFMRKYHPEN